MRGVNKVVLLGRATKDSELRRTESGKAVSHSRIATNRVVRNKAQELEERPQYHTVICWEKLAEQTAKHLTKGRLVYVEGRLESRTFTDRDGNEREVTEIIASDVQFLDARARRDDVPATDGDELLAEGAGE